MERSFVHGKSEQILEAIQKIETLKLSGQDKSQEKR